MEKLEKTIKCKDSSLETKSKNMHTILFPIPMRGTVKKTDKWGKLIYLKGGAGGKLCRYPGVLYKQVGPRLNQELSMEANMLKPGVCTTLGTL